MKSLMRWVALGFLAGVVGAAASCAPGPARSDYDSWYTGPRDGCVEVFVRNDRFEDAVITYTGHGRQRVGLATGKTVTELELCGQGDRESVFQVHGIGGAYDFTLRGHQRLSDRPVYIVIGLTRTQSWVEGDGYGAGDGTLEFNELQLLPVMGVHAGIWYDVVECLGLDITEVMDPRDVTWGVATEIIHLEAGLYLYGAAILEEEHGGPMIVIERPYWFHASIISHEVAHVLGEPEGSVGLARCTMPVPGELERRSVEDGG